MQITRPVSLRIGNSNHLPAPGLFAQRARSPGPGLRPTVLGRSVRRPGYPVGRRAGRSIPGLARCLAPPPPGPSPGPACRRASVQARRLGDQRKCPSSSSSAQPGVPPVVPAPRAAARADEAAAPDPLHERLVLRCDVGMTVHARIIPRVVAAVVAHLWRGCLRRKRRCSAEASQLIQTYRTGAAQLTVPVAASGSRFPSSTREDWGHRKKTS
jgi:hypothetical protein